MLHPDEVENATRIGHDNQTGRNTATMEQTNRINRINNCHQPPTVLTSNKYQESNSVFTEEISKEAKNQDPTSTNLKSNIPRKRLVILADSHGKNLSSLIEPRTNVNVCSYVRPGAKFDRVTEEIKSLSKDLGKEDYQNTTVLAGTNNIETTGVKRLTDIKKNL